MVVVKSTTPYYTRSNSRKYHLTVESVAVASEQQWRYQTFIPTSNPSKISNGTKSKNVNTLLDFVSDAALVTPKITDQLQIEDQ